MRLERELKCNFWLEENVTPSSDEIEIESTPDETSGVEECGFFKKEDYCGDENKFKVCFTFMIDCYKWFSEPKKNVSTPVDFFGLWQNTFS